MELILKSAIPITAFATLAVLCVGVFGLLRGGAFNASYSNKLMRLRVLLQGLTVLIAMGALYLAGGR